MPGINDSPEQVEKILELCGEAGAVNIGGIPLHLRGEVRDIFMEWLRSYRPDLVERYEQLYRRGAYVPRAEQERLQALVRRFRPRQRDGPPPRSAPNLRGIPPPDAGSARQGSSRDQGSLPAGDQWGPPRHEPLPPGQWPLPRRQGSSPPRRESVPRHDPPPPRRGAPPARKEPPPRREPPPRQESLFSLGNQEDP
jgi:hypothetical protein